SDFILHIIWLERWISASHTTDLKGNELPPDQVHNASRKPPNWLKSLLIELRNKEAWDIPLLQRGRLRSTSGATERLQSPESRALLFDLGDPFRPSSHSAPRWRRNAGTPSL